MMANIPIVEIESDDEIEYQQKTNCKFGIGCILFKFNLFVSSIECLKLAHIKVMMPTCTENKCIFLKCFGHLIISTNAHHPPFYPYFPRSYQK